MAHVTSCSCGEVYDKKILDRCPVCGRPAGDSRGRSAEGGMNANLGAGRRGENHDRDF